jgi:hypothetical protein
MTRYFYDTEFIEDGSTIDLISIGIVADDGREFYAVSSEFSVRKLCSNPWLVENVRPSLPGRETPGCRCIAGWHLDKDDPVVRSRAQIARSVRDFILAGGPDVELWADYAAYDHVVLCQLFGRMIDLPDGFPMWTHDFQQEWERAGRPELPEQAGGLHNALADARHLHAQYQALDQLRAH